jgi:hypothetical protein
MCAYAAKYAAKQSQKVIPAKFGWSGRFWGVCGCRVTMAAATFVSDRACLSKAVIRNVQTLNNYIKINESNGNIVEVGKENSPAKVFYCKLEIAIIKIRLMIMQINVACSLYADSRMMWTPIELEREDTDFIESEAEEELAAITALARSNREKMLQQA